MTEKKCKECEGGCWYDASHGCTRKCNACKGTGRVSEERVEPTDYMDLSYEERTGKYSGPKGA